MSKLSELAAIARAWIQARMAAGSRGRTDDPLEFEDIRSGAPPIILRASARVSATKAPNVSAETPKPTAAIEESDEEFDDIQLLGRDESYDSEGWSAFQSTMRMVESSNVYAYGFQPENNRSGILYVTFLNWAPKDMGGDASREGAGPTYAYYDFPIAKYKAFEAEASSSAGSAVWDFCRVRHSAFEHQHTYRLIQTAGDYVPRKATAGGLKARSVRNSGPARQQLLPRSTAYRQVHPGRDYAASPNRAQPNRGRPDRRS